jgi:hypothetical protein
MPYKTKPYREAYRNNIRTLAKEYGVSTLSTLGLNYKVFKIQGMAIPLRAKRLVLRNQKMVKERVKRWKLEIFRAEISKWTPKRILPLP